MPGGDLKRGCSMKTFGRLASAMAPMLVVHQAMAADGGAVLVTASSQGPAMLAMAAGFVALGVFRARLRWAAQGGRDPVESGTR
jgi:hypothetical protein